MSAVFKTKNQRKMSEDRPPHFCPVKTEEVIERLTILEEKLKEDRKLRHELNSHLSSVVDEERKERMELSESMDAATYSIGRLEKMHTEVLEVLKGSWHQVGMVNEFKNIQSRVTEIERKDTRRAAFISGMMIVASTLGAVIGVGLKVMVDFLRG